MRHSLKSKMTAIVLLVAAALSVTAVLVGYKVYSRVMDSYYTNHAMNLAGTVAATVDKTDMRRYADQVLRIYGGSGLRDEETEEGQQKYFALFDGVEDGNYRRELKQLRDIKRVNDILYLYIITTDPATRAGIYVMDSDESDGVCPIGTWGCSMMRIRRCLRIRSEGFPPISAIPGTLAGCAPPERLLWIRSAE